MPKFVPLYDRVLVALIDRELISEGIYLPETSKEEMKTGVVAAVGEGYVSDTGEVRPLRTRVGDKVLFGPYAGSPIQIEDHPFLIMREGELYGVVQEQT